MKFQYSTTDWFVDITRMLWIAGITPKSDGKKALSADQKQFNSLTKKIDRQKQRLIEWKATIPLYRQQVEQEYE